MHEACGNGGCFASEKMMRTGESSGNAVMADVLHVKKRCGRARLAVME